MLDFLLGNKEIIGTVVGGVGTLVGYAWLRKDVTKLFGEGADVYQAIVDAKADGKYTEEEIKEIAKQSGEFMGVALVLWIKLRKRFTKNG